MNYIDNKTHIRNVMYNLRRLIPWIIGGALIIMGVKMAFATWVSMNVEQVSNVHTQFE